MSAATELAIAPLRLSQSLMEFWMLPFRFTQGLLASGTRLVEERTGQVEQAAGAAAERSEEVGSTIVAEAEDRLGELDERAGDTAVNPAALVS